LKKELPSAILASKTRAASIAYEQIPCCVEQGFFLHEQAILSREQGILRLGALGRTDPWVTLLRVDLGARRGSMVE
jgi:hypothetical protein